MENVGRKKTFEFVDYVEYCNTILSRKVIDTIYHRRILMLFIVVKFFVGHKIFSFV